MNHLFQPDGLPAYESRLRHHLDWMREWAVDRALRQDEASTEGLVPPSDPLQGAIVPFRRRGVFETPAFDDAPAELETGCVRLLSPELSGPSDRPIYILLLGQWMEDWLWFMPFSPYSSPATNWEMTTGMDAAPLQILQVWNARSAPVSLLANGWTADHAPPGLVEEAKQLYRSFLDGTALSETLAARTGTQIVSTPDPRTDYLARETELLDFLTYESMTMLESFEEESPSNVIRFEKTEQAFALAAADGAAERPLETRAARLEGTDTRIHLMELESQRDAFTLVVENDEEGLLEGAEVLDAAGSPQGTIHSGRAGSARTPLLLVRDGSIQFSIRLADGTPVKLTPTS